MKEKMVTRTFKTTEATILGVNTATKAADEVIIVVTGEPKDEVILKTANTKYAGTEFKPSFVTKKVVKERVLGIPESYFIENGVEVERPASQQKKAEN